MKTTKSSPNQATSKGKQTTTSKIDPSFKSKRYRDKLRTEVKALEALLPVDRPGLHRKLDSQTVYRLVIAYLRIKCFFSSQKDVLQTKDKCHCSSEEHSSGRNISGDVVGTIEEQTKCEAAIATDFFKGTNLFQILDGFLLAASTDGTILYVSENVTHYLGFNQVDLMHRCIYGAIHPEDHIDLKKVLEKNEARTSDSSQVPPVRCNRQGVTKAVCGDSESYPVSFLCRMKSFSGNTIGYTKLHCIGKVQCSLELPKSSRTSNHIILLYCQPFMLTGNDVTDEVKPDVFWTKHDLDLKFKDIDKNAKMLTGYECEELNGRSFYDLVHPEDLHTCGSVHKALTENTDVQTMYFRLQTKDGSWLWAHSRGKVICKNSKKFSIVMSHSPIREQDSTFIQEVSTMRQRYALQDLICQRQHTQRELGFHFDPDVSKSLSPSVSSPYYSDSLNEGVAFTIQSNMVQCPSSWHTLVDRHSPVLPSTHVAHKITQREKQLQFAEFKRRQHLEQNLATGRPHNCDVYTNPNGCIPSFHFAMQCHQLFEEQPTTFHNNHPMGIQTANGDSCLTNPGCFEKTVTYNPHQNYFNCVPKNMNADANFAQFGPNRGYETGNGQLPPVLYRQNVNGNYVPTQSYNFPPSPPPSPVPGFHRHQKMAYPAGPIESSASVQDYSLNRNNFRQGYSQEMPVSLSNHFVKHELEEPFCKRVKSGTVVNNEKQLLCPSQHSYQSHANIRLSMLCNTFSGENLAIPEFINHNVDSSWPRKYHNNQKDIWGVIGPPTQKAANHIYSFQTNHSKLTDNGSQSCAKAATFCKNPSEFVQYDIEASVHMKIVENDRKSSDGYSRKEVEMPLYGSFLEYLNENQ